MTNNPQQDIDARALADSVVELTAPDGTLYRFRLGAVLPYEGQEYVVLVELNLGGQDEEQLLITRLYEAPEGELSFEVVAEEEVIGAVLQMYTAERVHDSMASNGLSEHDYPDGGKCCGHDHHSHPDGGKCCGHEHAHAEDSCGDCGCTH